MHIPRYNITFRSSASQPFAARFLAPRTSRAACSHRHSCVHSVRIIAHMSLFRCHRYNSHARLPHPWCAATFICPPHRGSPLIHLPVIPHSPLTSSHTRYNTLHNMHSSEALPHLLYISRSHQALSHSLYVSHSLRESPPMLYSQLHVLTVNSFVSRFAGRTS